jgi:hypothetical protein
MADMEAACGRSQGVVETTGLGSRGPSVMRLSIGKVADKAVFRATDCSYNGYRQSELRPQSHAGSLTPSCVKIRSYQAILFSLGQRSMFAGEVENSINQHFRPGIHGDVLLPGHRDTAAFREQLL